MKLRYYIKRIINDRLKLACIVFVLFIVIFDLFPRIYFFSVGGTPERADFNSFLAATGSSMVPNALIFWFLPIYLLLISVEDIIEDFQTGYYNILITSYGKKTYINSNLIKSFFVSFSIVFLSLVLNLLLAHIIFNSATYSRFDDLIMNFEETHLIVRSIRNPLITNICFIFSTSFLSGIVGMTGATIALVIHERKYIYSISFVLWFIPFCFHKSIMLSLQPFTEYNLNEIIPTYLFTLFIHLLLTTIMYIRKMKYEKI